MGRWTSREGTTQSVLSRPRSKRVACCWRLGWPNSQCGIAGAGLRSCAPFGGPGRDSARGGGTADRGFVSAAQKKAAALYTQAGDYQKTARFYYKKAEDTYYQANNWASYDDWRRARDQWDYFYSRNRCTFCAAVSAVLP